MKKLFSYLLISSMVVLSSCTNYDDQFDDLNTQINTLKSQIEGFSSLSSGLTSLQGTVASLQTAINNIPVTPATDISGLQSTQAALQTALTALATQVTALQTTLSTAATSTDVLNLTAALDKVKADLADLLASNNVYTPAATGLVINSAASLEVAKSLGGKLAIINGGVDITNGTANALNAADLQAVLDKMVTITGTMTYTQNGTGSAPNFDALTSAGNLSIDNEHAISLAALSNVGTLTVSDDVKVTSFSAPKLATVAFASHTLDLPKATKIDLTSLTAYANASLTINGNTSSTGFDLLMPNIQSNGPDGIVRNNFVLTIGGVVKDLTLAKMVSKSSRIIANDAKVVNLAAFNGTLDSGINSNHINVTLGAAMKDYTSGSKLETFKGTGVLDPAVLTSVGPTFTFAATSVKLDTVEVLGQVGDLDFNGNDSVTVVTISADASSVDLSESTSLTSAVISGDIDDAVDFTSSTSLETATVSGDAESITFDGNSSLTSVSLTGGTGYVMVNNCDSLTSLALAHTSKWFANRDDSTTAAAAAVAAAKLGAELHITGNAELTSLTADKITLVEDLIITSNPLLASVSFDAITASAAATTATSADPAIVNIGAVSDGTDKGATIDAAANNLHAQSITLGTSVAVTDGSKVTGTITSNSGLSDLAAFLKATTAKAYHDVAVVFDEVEVFTDETGVSVQEISLSSSNPAAVGETPEEIVVVASSKNNSAGTTGTSRAVSTAYEVTAAAADGFTITVNGTTKSYTRGNATAHPTLTDFLDDISADSYWNGTASITNGTLDSYSLFTSTATSTVLTSTYLYLDSNTATTTSRIPLTGLEIGTASTTNDISTAIAGALSNTIIENYTSGAWVSSTTSVTYQATSAGDAATIKVYGTKNIATTGSLRVKDRTTAGFTKMYSPDLSFTANPGGHDTEYLKIADAVVTVADATNISIVDLISATSTALSTYHEVSATGAVTHKTSGVAGYVGTTLLTNPQADEFVSVANTSNGRGEALNTTDAAIANSSPRYVTTYWTWN